MITITRQFALRIRNLLRRIGLQGRSTYNSVPVLFLASNEGFHVRAVNNLTALEYHQPGPLPPAQFALPVEALAACEGKRETPVTIESAPEGKISVSWEDRGLPQVRLYDDCRDQVLDGWPKRPERFSTNDFRLVEALQQTAGIVDRSPNYRAALDTVQLQGTGKVVATDSRQALVIRGEFKFPWNDDVLVLPTDVFGFADFPRDVPVEIGATETHVCVNVRPWTLYLSRVNDRKYPKVEEACPPRASVKTRVQIPAEDREFLSQSLRHLPGREVPDSAVTVDCNGHLAIRAQVAGESPVTELVLSRSQVSGDPVQFNTNRRFLEQAIQFGFSELQIVDANAPCLCEDERRSYFWMGLGAEDAIRPSKKCVRIDSAAASASQDPLNRKISRQPSQSPTPTERSPTMRRASSANGQSDHATNASDPAHDGQQFPATAGASRPEATATSNGHAAGNGSASGATTESAESNGTVQDPAALDPITAAEALQGDLRTALASTSRLLQALRRNRKQARLVENTIASLRQLQGV
ncbi:MAG: hypothetical protein HY290_29595 [Planctomycetia bacterium]|nr:hypothetical protein [Planctomycetia bacterium]